MIGVLILLAMGTLLITNHWLTRSLTATTRNQAELRLTLYSSNMLTEIQRTAVVPLLLSGDPILNQGLRSGNYTAVSQRFIDVQREIGVAAILLLDKEGRVVGATNRAKLGEDDRNKPYFIEASRAQSTVFSVDKTNTGAFDFFYSSAVFLDGEVVGVIAITLDLQKYAQSWVGFQDTIFVVDGAGEIVLSSKPELRGLSLKKVLAQPSSLWWNTRATQSIADPPDAYVQGKAVMMSEARVPFQEWEMVTLTAYDSISDRVIGVLAIEVMIFAVLLAFSFYVLSRREMSRALRLEQESGTLRQLNTQLSREIAMREKAQKDLAVAELTLAQASKLTVMGEMSAAVSHELNQPLTAMKTYLAGARLLVQRQHFEEALSSFQRIDDLIERMRTITRQLKSYARKGGDTVQEIDLVQALSSALTMMEPTLKTSNVSIIRPLSKTPVMVMADSVRLEQVIINVLRNALDATAQTAAPRISLELWQDHMARLSIADNGPGISNLDSVFEPFYTTKEPGQGVGLGLAISSGIMNGFGGRLTARNSENGGAIFEITLPLAHGPPHLTSPPSS